MGSSEPYRVTAAQSGISNKSKAKSFSSATRPSQLESGALFFSPNMITVCLWPFHVRMGSWDRARLAWRALPIGIGHASFVGNAAPRAVDPPGAQFPSQSPSCQFSISAHSRLISRRPARCLPAADVWRWTTSSMRRYPRYRPISQPSDWALNLVGPGAGFPAMAASYAA